MSDHVAPIRRMVRGSHESVLVLNTGSSSVKYKLINPVGGEVIASGSVDQIGEERSTIEHRFAGLTTQRERYVEDHGDALSEVLDIFEAVGPHLADAGIVAVGHRIVQGGSVFDGPTIIDDDVVAEIDRLSPLAPLHNPAHLRGVAVAREKLPDVPHVAVFDTSFFRSIPAAASTYAIDADIAEKYQIKRYGAHGTSHQYVSGKVARVLGRKLEDLNQIVLHLGNGASVSAVKGGAAVETSMGLTPLEGLVMGTRSGDIDPAVVFHLHRNAGMSIDEIDDMLNRRSGIKGLTGQNDFRHLHRLISEGDENAKLAFEVFVHRIRKYIGAYSAVLGRVDVVTFTAGVGENDPATRAEVIRGLEPLGLAIDPVRNVGPKSGPTIISPDWTSTLVMVVPTNEELAIARLVLATVA